MLAVGACIGAFTAGCGESDPQRTTDSLILTTAHDVYTYTPGIDKNSRGNVSVIAAGKKVGALCIEESPSDTTGITDAVRLAAPYAGQVAALELLDVSTNRPVDPFELEADQIRERLDTCS